jgi:hypothetical protein
MLVAPSSKVLSFLLDLITYLVDFRLDLDIKGVTSNPYYFLVCGLSTLLSLFLLGVLFTKI